MLHSYYRTQRYHNTSVRSKVPKVILLEDPWRSPKSCSQHILQGHVNNEARTLSSWAVTFPGRSSQEAGLGSWYSVLILAVLEYWISCTHTLLVVVSSNVIVLLLVLVDKYSGTRTSTGLSTDILWYIWDIRIKTIIPMKYTIWLFIKEKF